MQEIKLKRLLPLLIATFLTTVAYSQNKHKKRVAKDSVWLQGSSASDLLAVSYYDSTKADNGVTLLDQHTYSILVDMNGKVLARFPFGLTEVSSDGTIHANMEGNVVKLDKDLDIFWKAAVIPHHEITTDENGAVYLFSTDTHEFMGLLVNFDVLKILSPEGKTIYEWHVFDHIEEVVSMISKSAYLSTLPEPYQPQKGAREYIAQDPEQFFFYLKPANLENPIFEFTHCNSIQVLPENEVSKKIPAFKKGNLLLSFNPYSCYGILDTASGKIEWAGYLPERTTLHTPLLTPKGTILVYQNSTPSKGLWGNREGDSVIAYLTQKISPKNPAREPEARNWVSVTEYDPLTNKKVWEYTATPKESLIANMLGNAQRLPNGNTLVCTSNGKGGSLILEITPAKKIVWRYISPERDLKNNLPFTFYRAKRISSDVAKKIVPGYK